MAGVEESVARRLASVQDSEESVQTIALWLTTQHRLSARVVDVWRDELRKGARRQKEEEEARERERERERENGRELGKDIGTRR